MPLTILGVDPGGRETGLALVRGDHLLAHDVVVGPKVDQRAPANLEYLADVVARAELLVDDPVYLLDAIAIEAVTAPNPHEGMTNVTGAIATASLLGYVAAWGYERKGLEPGRVILIDTEGHGSGLLQAYPAPLRPTRGKGRGHDLLRHARSAYDVALAAPFNLRLATASG